MPVPLEGITAIAMDCLQPTKGQLKLDTNELWVMVGGLDGLKSMYANAEILLAVGFSRRSNSLPRIPTNASRPLSNVSLAFWAKT